MADLRSIRRREDLPSELKALSDVLDEYLIRMYGITSGWTHPVEFREFLAEEGLVIVSKADLDHTVRAAHLKDTFRPSVYSRLCDTLGVDQIGESQPNA
ncbi:hypothetical protein ACIBG7_43145 [Nonomuraea sp. NPDC050328]|uniref:hypothetical protein n=1 Tax=Nonomuraea sp. NPDC050328 TaxID=3364361 RepID=UPI0037A6D83F